METNLKELTINGVDYIQKGENGSYKLAEKDGLDYVIIRTYSAGVFAGYLEKKEKDEVVLRNARRIWFWDGAASISQLAMEGTSKPDKCKFPCEVDKILLPNVIEIIFCTEKARKSICEVKIWKE